MILAANNLNAVPVTKAAEAPKNISLAKAVYWIEGLFCGNCATALEKKIKALNIVEGIHINFTYSYMIVDHYGDVEVINTIENTVRKLGYKLTSANLDIRKQQLEDQQKKAYSFLFFAFIFSMWSMLCAVVTYMHPPGELEEQTLYWLNMSSGLFSIPVVFAAGFHFHKMAWLALRSRLFNIDLLISTSALSAFFISAYFLWHHVDVVYFDTACMLILLHLFGRTIDLNTKTKALQCLEEEISLTKNEQVMRVDYHNQLESISINAIKAGDHLVLRLGDKLPVDAELLCDSALVNTSVLTGESLPGHYQQGAELAAGFINMGKSIHVKANCAVGSSDNDYQLIDILMNKAKQSGQSDKINQLSARLSKFIFAVSVLAGAVVFATHADLQLAFERVLCVLVIACPCSLTIAMPMASLILNRQSVKKRIVINNCSAFIESKNLSAWYFDKTGTLTEGEPKLSAVHVFNSDYTATQVLQHAYQCVYNSGHIYSNLIREHIDQKIKATLIPGNYQETLGYGIEWISEDGLLTVALGSKKWFVEQGYPLFTQDKFTSSYLVINQQAVAVFEFEDKIKANAQATLDALRDQTQVIGLLSGDNHKACQRVASSLALHTEHVHSDMSPKDKQAKIAQQSSADHKVAFIGDGLNDNLALMQADIGIATQKACALTKLSATVCLLNDDLKTLTYLKPLATLYHSLVRRNLMYAVIYNMIAIPVALFGNISPLVAIGAMAASSISISLNSYIFNEKMESL
jgi:heavy metal translocating P-type ATPase